MTRLCPNCGARLTHHTTRTQKGVRWRYFTCPACPDWKPHSWTDRQAVGPVSRLYPCAKRRKVLA